MSSDRPLIVTFPGKYGDLLWMLPTLRALSRRRGHPIDLLIPEQFGDIAPLLMRQPYIDAVLSHSAWRVYEASPISPRVPPPEVLSRLPAAEFLHAGYRDWPMPNTVLHTLSTLNEETLRLGLRTLNRDNQGIGIIEPADLQLETPWITLDGDGDGDEADREGMVYTETPWIAGFTDEYFELKFGMWKLLTVHRPFAFDAVLGLKDCRPEFLWEAEERTPLSISHGPRWRAEGFHTGANWLDGAHWLSKTEAFLGDCSAWHVLAAAMGVPVVLMEPQAARHNAAFYPLPERKVFLVKGNDGKPTFDARHTAEALTHAIEVGRSRVARERL